MRFAWAGVLVASGCIVAPQARLGDATTTAHRHPALEGHMLLDRVRSLMEVPRVLGDPQRDAGIEQLTAQLREAGAQPTVQRFEARDPGSDDVHSLQNLYGTIRPEAPHQFVLATHFDVRPWAEEDPNPAIRASPIPGANDGTSGVAIVLALTEVLRDTLPSDVGFTVALFDGEELGRPSGGGYCAGSKALEADLSSAPPAMRRAAFGIVLDMVGDADLQLAMEPNSVRQHPTLVQEIWDVAARTGERAFVHRRYERAIIDDHVYLSRAGIPSVLLIDYDYPAWHTHGDDVSQLSGASLQSVATVVHATLMEHAWPPPSGDAISE